MFSPALNAQALSYIGAGITARYDDARFSRVLGCIYHIMQLVIEIYIIIIIYAPQHAYSVLPAGPPDDSESQNPGDGGSGQMYARYAQYTSTGRKKNNGADLWAVVLHITCTRGRFSREGIRTRLYYTHRGMRKKSPTTTRWEKVASTETKEKTHTTTHARPARILHNIIIYIITNRF